jgi:hypothetical protein
VLIIGLFAMTTLLIVGGIDVTAAQLARVRLVDAADAAALDAADALDEGGAYGRGVADTVRLSNDTVVDAATGYLRLRPTPPGMTAWAVDGGTGSSDGRTAVVVLSGIVDLPLTGGLLSALGRDVTITVQARARAPLR